MRGKTGFHLLALFAVAATAALAWLMQPAAVAASLSAPIIDTDDDFLPDCVEWVVLTSASNPDTDGDQVPDFVEVVQRGQPRHPSEPLPSDQEMRIVVTGPQPGTGGTTAWLHVLVRLQNFGDPINSFQTWLEFPSWPQLQLPFYLFSAPDVVVRERATMAHGHWIHVAVPLGSLAVLRAFMPCSLHAQTDMGGRIVSSVVHLFDIKDDLCSLVPYGNDRHVLQNIAPTFAGGASQSNRVCLLELLEVGSGPGGIAYEVVDAYCEDCNELECGPGCTDSIGWILTLPGGVDAGPR